MDWCISRCLVTFDSVLQLISHFSLNHQSDQQPDPPLKIKYQGQLYSLAHSMSIRKSQETVRDTDLQQWQGGALPWAFDGVIEASTESALDLESKEKSTSCTVSPRCNFNITKPDGFTGTQHRLPHR